jgi:iron-sulfur cluster insertion protein
MEITFTDNAINKIKEVMSGEKDSSLALRVFVSGGGCSGFQYGFTLDDATNDDDWSVEKDGVRMLVDSMSYQYLMGATVDYSEGLSGAQFTIKNPNATSTCGCGSSFAAD